MRGIVVEDECNDTYGCCRMYQALKLKYPDEDIPSERTVYRSMDEIELSYRPKCKPGGITKADRNARKSEDLLKRDFSAEKSLEKCVTDITEISARDGTLVCPTPSIGGAIIHSDCGSQYTSMLYRGDLQRWGIIRSMNRDGGRCHDNACCEAMWARMKEELLYGRYDTKQMTMEELKTLIWRYYMIYWNTRRICSANGGLPPMIKRKQYYESLEQAA